LQAADFLDVMDYQEGCGKVVKVEKFPFIIMILLLYIPMVVTLLLMIACGVMKLKSRLAYLFKYEPVKK